jgi:hypothetical protein
MNFDGSLTLQGAGAGVVLISPDGHTLKYAVQLGFRATNNMAVGLGVHRLPVRGDLLIINEVSKEYQCVDPQMAAYVAEVRRMEWHFD